MCRPSVNGMGLRNRTAIQLIKMHWGVNKLRCEFNVFRHLTACYLRLHGNELYFKFILNVHHFMITFIVFKICLKCTAEYTNTHLW